jgi:hypothetical protein
MIYEVYQINETKKIQYSTKLFEAETPEEAVQKYIDNSSRPINKKIVALDTNYYFKGVNV